MELKSSKNGKEKTKHCNFLFSFQISYRNIPVEEIAKKYDLNGSNLNKPYKKLSLDK
jgi:hypothetical protein